MSVQNVPTTATHKITIVAVFIILLSFGCEISAGPNSSPSSNLAALKNTDDNMRHAAYLMEHVAKAPACSEIARQVNAAANSMNYSGGSRQRIENIASQIEETNCVCSTPPKI